MPVRPAIIPHLRYEDARGAIAFLCAAFGFTEHAVHAEPGDDSRIVHAQLLHDGGMIMLSSAEDTASAEAAPLRTVRQAGGDTVSLYIVVDDVDGHAAHARAAGADIVMEPDDKDYGGRGYGARDPEGNVWWFGSYDPFA